MMNETIIHQAVENLARERFKKVVELEKKVVELGKKVVELKAENKELEESNERLHQLYANERAKNKRLLEK